MDLFAAAATRFTNVATSFLRSGSLISEAALLGSTHWTVRCSNSGQTSLCLLNQQWKDSDLADRLYARLVE
jgi:invasion protein IalB